MAKISPLKASPLRNPGESLHRRLVDVGMDKIIFHYMVIVILLLSAFFIWLPYVTGGQVNPYFWTLLILPFMGFSVARIFQGFREAKKIKLGLMGEKAVGQFLERLRLDGAQVFHDIEGENFNLDHVVIHRSGVYVIETKTMSKSDKHKSVLFYNGKQILRGGQPIQSDALTQVKAASGWLHKQLFESTGKRFNVRGIVVFPGWYVKTTELGRKANVSVLNPLVLPNYIGKAKSQLRDDEVHMCAYHLSRYVRTT
ncbi:nuclease-related domain-containing protein [Pseudidiomarina woesei]|uniref:Nuclease-related domain n=1 Tax=Pseudidiomarina woesei TaxID=1381080 RepID=A0A0K6H4S4_9GAMM|nr:nuclease-related domain-containing protein [Pseudidiomarina woesei]CUA85827.1 Nuclease-related domain [Pseudidiomarina woesei]